MAQSAPASSRAVLLAVANDEAWQIASAALRRRGYTVRQAADPAALLQQVRQDPPDALVLDTDLLHGLEPEAAAALHETLAPIPAVICTSDPAAGRAVAQQGTATRAILVRPFSFVELAGRVSELVEAKERAPDDGEQFAQCAAEALPFPLVAMDLDRRVRFWNAAAERLFGWTAAEARGRYMEDLVPSDLTPEQIQSIRTHARAGKVWHQHRLVQSRDGAVRRVAVTTAPIRDASGRLLGQVAAFAEAVATADPAIPGSVEEPLPPGHGARPVPVPPSLASRRHGQGEGGRREPPDERARRYAGMVRAGQSLRQIAAQEGISYERVRQVLARAGYRRDRDLKGPSAA